MIQGITKQEFIEILDERLDQKLDQKLNQKLDEQMIKIEEKLEQKLEEGLDEKINAFALIVGKSFQVIEDKIDTLATKEELWVLESRMDKKFNKLDSKIDNYKGNTDRRIDWLTDEVIKLKSA